MAYAEYTSEKGFFSNLFASAEDRKAKREKNAEYERKKSEIDLISERELLEMGYCRQDMQEMLYRQYFSG